MSPVSSAMPHLSLCLPQRLTTAPALGAESAPPSGQENHVPGALGFDATIR